MLLLAWGYELIVSHCILKQWSDCWIQQALICKTTQYANRCRDRTVHPTCTQTKATEQKFLSKAMHAHVPPPQYTSMTGSPCLWAMTSQTVQKGVLGVQVSKDVDSGITHYVCIHVASEVTTKAARELDPTSPVALPKLPNGMAETPTARSAITMSHAGVACG